MMASHGETDILVTGELPNHPQHKPRLTQLTRAKCNFNMHTEHRTTGITVVTQRTERHVNTDRDRQRQTNTQTESGSGLVLTPSHQIVEDWLEEKAKGLK